MQKQFKSVIVLINGQVVVLRMLVLKILINQVIIIIYLCKITIAIHQLEAKEASKESPSVKLTYEDGKLKMKYKTYNYYHHS